MVKIASAVHELLHTSIIGDLAYKLRVLETRKPMFGWVGKTHFVSLTSRRSKEADQALMPAGRTAAHDFPSFIIEAGVSESLGELRTDAEFWQLNSGNGCRMVLVVAVNRKSRWIVFELYERGTVTGLATRTSPSPSPIAAATLRQPQIVLQHSGGAIGPPDLTIPLASLFDAGTLPHELAGQNIVLNAQELRDVYDKVWLLSGV